MDAGRCLLCNDRGALQSSLCAPCIGDLPRIVNACPRCGTPRPETMLCGACAQSAPPFNAVFAGFPYLFPIDRMIQDWKYHGRPLWLPVLADGLLERLERDRYSVPQLLIPVPLHARKLCRRGFNQAAVLADHIGARLGIPVWKQVKRTRATQSQTGLMREDRRHNVRGAFALRTGVPRRRIALIDDVYTTGATTSEVARLLLERGAEEVQVWCVAHAADLTSARRDAAVSVRRP